MKIAISSSLDNCLRYCIICFPASWSSSPVGSFRIPQLFNFTGDSYSPVNFTLQGGSDGTYVVNLQIPKSVPAPDQKTPTMAEWLNFKNFTKLQPIIFNPVAAHPALTGVGIALEGLAIILATFALPHHRPRRMDQAAGGAPAPPPA